jgi:hypothetical protein
MIERTVLSLGVTVAAIASSSSFATAAGVNQQEQPSRDRAISTATTVSIAELTNVFGETGSSGVPAAIAPHPVALSQSVDNLQAEPVLGTPAPGTTVTTAAALSTAPVPASEAQASKLVNASTVAQTLTPGQATRSGPSYFGLGINIGAIDDGDTVLGKTSFALISKIGLTQYLSVRPAVLINGDATFLVPITLDFPSYNLHQISFAPYLGIGGAFSTGKGKSADLIISGGVDVPISAHLTATAAVNLGVIDGIDLGILLGVGYTFSGF